MYDAVSVEQAKLLKALSQQYYLNVLKHCYYDSLPLNFPAGNVIMRPSSPGAKGDALLGFEQL